VLGVLDSEDVRLDVTLVCHVLSKYVAHTFILSGDDRDQLEVGEH
jgi:predicted Zn-dependent protease with MMP-like domain